MNGRTTLEKLHVILAHIETMMERLDRMDKMVVSINRRMVPMSQFTDAVARLEAEVEETRGAVDSAAVLIQGLADYIRANATDPAALVAMADKLDADQAIIAEKVAANPVPPTV